MSSRPPGPKPRGGAAAAAGNGRAKGVKGDAAQTSDEVPPSRLLFCLANMIGSQVQVQLVTGGVYHGVLHTATPEPAGVAVVLRKAYLKDNPPADKPFEAPLKQPSKDDVVHEVIIKSKDVVQLLAVGIDLGFRPPPPPAGVDSFTDSAISRAGSIQDRELQRWVPESDGEGLELDTSSGSTWTAEEMFSRTNVVSTFNEDDYTIPLNRQAADFKERMKVAERLAREIETGDSSSNVHVREDRGLVDDSGLTEEERYSAVTGAVTRAPGAYVPPGARNQQAASQPSIADLKAFQQHFQLAPEKPTTPTTPPALSPGANAPPTSAVVPTPSVPTTVASATASAEPTPTDPRVAPTTTTSDAAAATTETTALSKKGLNPKAVPFSPKKPPAPSSPSQHMVQQPNHVHLPSHMQHHVPLQQHVVMVTDEYGRMPLPYAVPMGMPMPMMLRPPMYSPYPFAPSQPPYFDPYHHPNPNDFQPPYGN